MKSCHKSMLICAAIAIGLIFLLPQFGVAVGSASLLFPLIMVVCCVLPMFLMMKAAKSENGKSGCCGSKETYDAASDKDGAKKEPAAKSCH